MNKATYTALKTKVREEGLFKKNDVLAAGITLFEVVLMAGLVTWLVSTEPLSLAYFSSLALVGISAFRCFALLHECGHRALFNEARANTLTGYLMSLFCLIPFACWRDLHLQHHRWVGVVDKDPTQAGLLALKEASFIKRQAFRWVWWLCIPVPSIQLIVTVFWLHPLRLARANEKKAFEAGCALLLCLLPHLALLVVLGPAAYATYMLPAIVAYFFWFEAVNFTHHSGLFPYESVSHPEPIPLYEQDTVSRTSAFSRWVSTVLAYNFNFHTEHHYFPTVPWHHLPRVYELVQETEDLTHYRDVPFLDFSAQLRTSDPVRLYIDSLPGDEVRAG